MIYQQTSGNAWGDDADLLAYIRRASETAQKVWNDADERTRILDELDRAQAELTRRMLAAQNAGTGPLTQAPISGRHRNTDAERTQVIPAVERPVPDGWKLRLTTGQVVEVPGERPAFLRDPFPGRGTQPAMVPAGQSAGAERFGAALRKVSGWRGWVYRRMTMPRVVAASASLGVLLTLGVQWVWQVIA